MTQRDPRPLAGEPLSLDLLNTRWNGGPGGPHDLLGSLEGLALWLGAPEVARSLGDHPVAADQPTLDALLQARAAIAQVVDAPAGRGDRTAINAVLSHGRVQLYLAAQGPARRVETDAPAWYPAWLAAENCLTLLAGRPERIRVCAGHTCILHFYDTSKNGTRRWCSMAGCGNRAKASRHYARRHQD